ncbi:MAG TPA: DUF222 domain-containing protein, partial [Gammaproteobacteria bacterium]|nr:DUF222 domain-containing protein [Gammaproteobacteria bacterium]
LAHAHANRAVHYFYDDTDTFVLHARLPAEIGAIVRKALDAARDVLREADVDVGPPSPGEFLYGTWALTEPENSPAARRADALRHLAETFLARLSEETDGTPSADRYQVVVHVDQAVLTQAATASDREPHLSEIDDGPALAVDTVRRLACDGTLVGLVESESGEPLDIGRKTRAIPPALKRALRARDRGCRFPGCDRTRFTEGHHVRHWADGGETKLANLVTLCSFHHTLIHEGAFGVTATDDGLLLFTRPDGRRIPDAGAPRCGPHCDASQHGAECFRGNNFGVVRSSTPIDDSSTALRAHLRRIAPDLHVDASTSRCRWLGERMDYSQAIEGMQFLRDRALSSAHEAAFEPQGPATG